MGVIQHHAVIATTSHEAQILTIKEWLKNLKIERGIRGDDPRSLFVFSESIVNGYFTVVIVPDGSKEGWPDSHLGDSLREQLIAQLEAEKFEDGSNCWSWVEVSFGECGQKLTRGNNVQD